MGLLKTVRFTGEVWALPEGSIFFRVEPVVEVSGPIIEAQLAETFIVNAMNFQTMIATKAARCTTAAGDRHLVDFSLRRTQGVDAGLKVARASYLGGFAGTSNVLAGKLYDLPIFGTMARGQLLAPLLPVTTCRDYFLSEFARLPMNYKSLKEPPTYPVRISPELTARQHQVEQQIHRQELGKLRRRGRWAKAGPLKKRLRARRKAIPAAIPCSKLTENRKLETKNIWV